MQCLAAQLGGIRSRCDASRTGHRTQYIAHRRQAFRAHARSKCVPCTAKHDPKYSTDGSTSVEERSTNSAAGQHTEAASPDDATAVDTLSLLAVSGLWSTYSPALRYLYMLPGPPTPVALTTSRALLQAACLLPPVLLARGLCA